MSVGAIATKSIINVHFTILTGRHSPVWHNSDHRSAAESRHTPHTPLTRTPPGWSSLLAAAQETPALFSYTADPPPLPLLRHHGIARHHLRWGTLRALCVCPTEWHGQINTHCVIIFKGRIKERGHTPHRTADMKNTFQHNRIWGRISRSSRQPTASW